MNRFSVHLAWVAFLGASSGGTALASEAFGVSTEWFELTASDAAMSDYFGNSVSLSGDVAVIGAYGEDDGGSGSGSAYVYQFNGSAWVELAKLTASDAAENDGFGRSVSISGDMAVIGAWWDDHAGSFSGSAYVFEKPAGGWVDTTQTAKLTASDAAAGDSFGASVSISGEVAVIGARDADGRTGSAYIFQKPAEGGWVDTTETAKLTASDAAEMDFFGISVSISGDVAVIGAWGDDDAGSFSGSAYVFQKPANGWVDMTEETAKLTASDAAEGDHFGTSVSISGDVAVIGAMEDVNAIADGGSAYVFHKPVDGWVDMTETAKVIACDSAESDAFGASVSVSGDWAVIGAFGDDDGGHFSGSAYVFGRNTGGANQWGQVAKLIASDAATTDFLGYSVSASGDLAVIGAWRHSHTFADAGSAYVFALGRIDCNGNGIPDEFELGACCIPSTGCDDGWTQVLCLAAGGVFRGPCMVCPTQTLLIVVELGGSVFEHVIDPPVDCPSAFGPPPDVDCPVPPDVFIDPWTSPEDETMCHNFGAPGYAIPADFFATGSEPFTGVACLRGVPLGLTQWGDFGEADTLIARTEDPFDKCALPSPAEATVSIELVALSLEGVAPITVMVNAVPEQWEVTLVDLSVVTPPLGSLTAINDNCSGGTYTSVLNVLPRFTFTKVGEPAEVRFLDTGLEGLDPITLVQGTPAQWVSVIDPELGATGDPCSDFHAGIEEMEPPLDCDCNANTIHDRCDIEDCPPQDVTCQDCNADGVPDACQVAPSPGFPDGLCVADCSPDCNENGVPDECERDCNENGVADECDPQFTEIGLFVDEVVAESQDPALVCLFDQTGDGILNGGDIQGYVDRLLSLP